MELCIEKFLYIYVVVNIASAYNIKKALRIDEFRDEMGVDEISVDDKELLVFADVQGSPNKPILRHHIAHFCPNLDISRQCIRACMQKAKMAFCGKDHVCYCGHRYSYHDTNKEVPVDDVYAQFRDLYEKYFGKQDV